MMLAKVMKAACAAKAGASSALATDPNPPSTLPLPPPTTTEAPLGSSSPSPHSPEALQTPGSPLPIAAVPLAVASSLAPTPLDKGKRVLEIISDDETRMAWHPSRGGNLQGFPSYRRHRPRERILSGTTLPALLPFPPNRPRGYRRRRRVYSTYATGRGHCFSCPRRCRPRFYRHPSSNHASDEGLQWWNNARGLRQEGGHAFLLGGLLGGAGTWRLFT